MEPKFLKNGSKFWKKNFSFHKHLAVSIMKLDLVDFIFRI